VRCGPLGLKGKSLQPATSPAEQQVDDHKSKNEAQATTAVVADTGAYVVAAAAK
jgi:hypothetical protein